MELKDKRPASVNIKTVVISALVGALLAGGIFAALSLKPKNPLPASLEAVISEGEETITIRELESMMESVSELVTEKYYYTSCNEDRKEGTKVAGVTVPGTEELILVVYDGIISAGIDMSQVTYDINEEKKIITVTLPEPEVFSHEIDQNSVRAYDVKNALFSKKTYQDYASKLAEFKEQKISDLMSDGKFFEAVKQDAEKAMSDILTASQRANDYTIIFK